MSRIRTLMFAGLLIPLSGCLTDSQASSEIGFEVISADVVSSNGILENRKIEFISSQFAFDEALPRYTSEPGRQIDFTRNHVVLFNAGQSSDRVTRIRIDSVEEQNGALMIHAIETVAGEGCYTVATITSPYLFAKISSAARVRSVVVDREVVNCSAS